EPTQQCKPRPDARSARRAMGGAGPLSGGKSPQGTSGAWFAPEPTRWASATHCPPGAAREDGAPKEPRPPPATALNPPPAHSPTLLINPPPMPSHKMPFSHLHQRRHNRLIPYLAHRARDLID